MLKENMSKKVRNVLSVAAISAAIVPFAVNAASVNFTDVTATGNKYTYTDNDVIADADFTVAAGDSIEIDATAENVTVNLNGKKVTLVDGSIAVKGGKNVIFTGNGEIICSGNSATCIDATGNTGKVTFNNVKVTSKGTDQNAIDGTASTTITGATIEADGTGLALGIAGNVTGGVLKSGVDTNVEITGTVTAPISAVANAKNGATIKVDKLAASDFTTKVLTIADPSEGKVTVDLTGVDFLEKNADVYVIGSDYKIKYNSAKVNVVYPTTIFEKMITEDTLVVKKADTKAFDAATEAWTKLDADKKDEIKKNYESSLVDSIDAIIVKGASKDVRDQAVIDQMTNIINKMIKGEAITDSDKTLVKNEAVKPADKNAENKDNNAQQVADVKSEDNVATKNPKTADSILSYVGLAISSLAGLGVAAKKYLFK